MLETNSTVLVLIDIQGKLATRMHDVETLTRNLVTLVKTAKRLSIPVLWNEQVPEKLGPTIAELVALLDGDTPLAKSSFSCAGNPAFAEALRSTGRRQTLLVGIETHVCVCQTALHLLAAGYEVHVVADAVSSRTAENRRIALERMKDEGATITSTEMALFELLEKAEGEAFRELSRLVR